MDQCQRARSWKGESTEKSSGNAADEECSLEDLPPEDEYAGLSLSNFMSKV